MPASEAATLDDPTFGRLTAEPPDFNWWRGETEFEPVGRAVRVRIVADGDPTEEQRRFFAGLPERWHEAQAAARERIEAEMPEVLELIGPAAFGSAFELDDLSIFDCPPGAEEWVAVFWCEAAAHAFDVEYVGTSVQYVAMNG